jgi:hypothetical protein
VKAKTESEEQDSLMPKMPDSKRNQLPLSVRAFLLGGPTG